MDRNEIADLIIRNTLYGGFPDEQWGIQFPPEACDGMSVDLTRAQAIWLTRQLNIHGDPFHLYRGWDWVALGAAGYEILCEDLSELANHEPEDEYGRLYLESPNEAVRRWLNEVSDPLELAGFVVDKGRLYALEGQMSGLEARQEYD